MARAKPSPNLNDYVLNCFLPNCSAYESSKRQRLSFFIAKTLKLKYSEIKKLPENHGIVAEGQGNLLDSVLNQALQDGQQILKSNKIIYGKQHIQDPFLV